MQSDHQQLITARLRPTVDVYTTYAQVALPIEEGAQETPEALCNKLLSICNHPSGLVAIPEGSVLVLICHKSAVGDVYKTLRAAKQAGQQLLHVALPPVKQCIKLKDLSHTVLREAMARAICSTLIGRHNTWHWLVPHRVLTDTNLFATPLDNIHVQHSNSSMTTMHTLGVDVQLDADGTIELLMSCGTQRFRSLDLVHVLQRCPPALQQQHTIAHIVQTPTLLLQVNAALDPEGEVCTLLPWGQHAVLCRFSVHAVDAQHASQLLQRLRAQGFTGVPHNVQDVAYWAIVRGSDDPDAPEMSVLPGMVATSSGMVAGRAQVDGGMTTFVQQRVLEVLAGSHGVWGGATVVCSNDPQQSCATLVNAPTAWRTAHGSHIGPVVHHSKSTTTPKPVIGPALAAHLASVAAQREAQRVVPVKPVVAPRPAVRMAPVLKRRVQAFAGPAKKAKTTTAAKTTTKATAKTTSMKTTTTKTTTTKTTTMKATAKTTTTKTTTTSKAPPIGHLAQPGPQPGPQPSTKDPPAAIDVAAVKAKVEAHVRTGNTTMADVTIPELKALLKSMGKAVGGKKAVLVARVLESSGKTT